jgi:hypothetical protein
MNTINAQPIPISSRLAPVMLARTSEHGEAPSEPGAWQEVPCSANSWPPFQANTNPTAYSGRTAIRASTPMARLADTSSWAASAAQASTNAAPITATPKVRASTGGASSGWPRWNSSARPR